MGKCLLFSMFLVLTNISNSMFKCCMMPDVIPPLTRTVLPTSCLGVIIVARDRETYDARFERHPKYPQLRAIEDRQLILYDKGDSGSIQELRELSFAAQNLREQIIQQNYNSRNK